MPVFIIETSLLSVLDKNSLKVLEHTGCRVLSRNGDFVKTPASGDVVSVGLKVREEGEDTRIYPNRSDLINEQVMNIFFRKLISFFFF